MELIDYRMHVAPKVDRIIELLEELVEQGRPAAVPDLLDQLVEQGLVNRPVEESEPATAPGPSLEEQAFLAESAAKKAKRS